MMISCGAASCRRVRYQSSRFAIPIPASLLPLDQESDTGQRLLTILRALEKHPTTACSRHGDNGKEDDKTEKDMVSLLEDAVEILQLLITKCRRRGLMEGNVALAAKILSGDSTSSNNNNNNATSSTSSTNNRRGRKRNWNELTIYKDTLSASSSSQSSGSSGAGGLDVRLILSAVTRILHPSFSSRDSKDENEDDESANEGSKKVRADPPTNRVLSLWECQLLLIPLAANICTSLCEHYWMSINVGASQTKCCMAEYELIAEFGKGFLNNIEKSLILLLQQLNQDCDVDVKDETVHALSCCLEASSALLGLFGGKLSRNRSLLGNLKAAAMESLVTTAIRGGHNANTSQLTVQATRVLVTIALAGPGAATDEWSQAIADTLANIYHLLAAVTPTDDDNDHIGMEAAHQQANNNIHATIKEYVAKLKDFSTTDSEKERVTMFLGLLTGQCQVLNGLLARDFHTGSTACNGVGNIDVMPLIRLVESMLSFPVICEGNFFGSKKRLRFETPVFDKQLFSPAALASEIASPIKMMGLDLLETMVLSLGPSVLLPHARQLTRLVRATLLTSISLPLRQVLDPTALIDLDIKQKRWLQDSIPIRTKAIQCFRVVLLAFGTDPQSSCRASTTGRSTVLMSEVERGLAIVCGCIIEELTPSKYQVLGSWGSLRDRASLVSASVDCLQASISTGGEYLLYTVRQLIESTTATCLADLRRNLSGRSTCLASFSAVKSSIIKLTCSCVTTPWQDVLGAVGGSCSAILLEELMQISNQLLEGRTEDATVVETAKAALRVCNQFLSPRGPVLFNNAVAIPSGAPLESAPLSTAAEVADSLDNTRSDIMKRAMLEEEKRGKRASQVGKVKSVVEESLVEKGLPSLQHGNDTERQADVAMSANKQKGEGEIDKKPPSEEKEKNAVHDLPSPKESDVKEMSTEPHLDSLDLKRSNVDDEDDDDEMEDFPEIVDSAPDAGDA